jgi:hypothetical protein
MREVGEVHRHAYAVIEAHAGRVGDRGKVAEHAMRLRLDPLGHLHGLRVEADLAGKVHGVACAHRLRVRADRGRGAFRLDGLLHAGILAE